MTFKQMFISPGGIRDILAAKDREPWKTALEQVRIDAEKALSQSAKSVATSVPKPTPDESWVKDKHLYYTAKPYWWFENGAWVRKDGKVNPGADRRDYEAAIAMSVAIRNLGLGYVFFRDVRYARKAILLLSAWCVDSGTKMTPRYTTHQSKIELSITMPALVFGFSLVENFSGWTTADRDAVREWIRELGKSAMSWDQPGNFNAWRVAMVSTAGVVCASKEMLDFAFAQWLHNVQREIVGVDGKNPETGLGYVWVNNKKVALKPGMFHAELPRTDALFYSTYALNAMVQAAEILSRHGFKTYTNKSLVLALGFHAPYLIDPKKWNAAGYLQASAAKAHLNYAIYELAFGQYKVQEYDDVVVRWGRPAFEQRVVGNVTAIISPKR